MCGEIINPFQTLMVQPLQPLKFGNGWVISFHTLLGMHVVAYFTFVSRMYIPSCMSSSNARARITRRSDSYIRITKTRASNFMDLMTTRTRSRASASTWKDFYYQNLHLDNEVHGANMRPIWGRQDPGGPHVGPMNFAIWTSVSVYVCVWVCAD